MLVMLNPLLNILICYSEVKRLPILGVSRLDTDAYFRLVRQLKRACAHYII